MHTILIPTDFSAVAEHAAHYATQMAKAMQARVVLFHAYHVPIISNDVPVMVPNLQAIEENSMELLKKLRANLHLQHGPHIKIDLECRCGFAVEEIENFVNEQKVDLVVMGMNGLGYLSEKLIGSVTTSVIQRLKLPVLVVNREATFTGLKKIALAYDYKALERKAVLDPLKTIGQLFRSHVYILKVCKPGELNKLPEVSEAVAGVRMDHLLEEIDHTFHFIDHDQVVEGINRFIEEKDIQLVAMIPHQHSLLERIFHGSDTKQMAFHLHVPLLTLPEK